MKLLLLLLTFPAVSESWYWIELKGDLRHRPVHFGKILEPDDERLNSRHVLPPRLHKHTHSAKIPKPSGELPLSSKGPVDVTVRRSPKYLPHRPVHFGKILEPGSKSLHSHRVLPPRLHKHTHSAKIPKPSGKLPLSSKGSVDVTVRRSPKMIDKNPVKQEKDSHIALTSSRIHLLRKHLRTRRGIPLRYYEHTHDKVQTSSNFGAFGFFPIRKNKKTRLRKREAPERGESVSSSKKATKKLKQLLEKPKKSVRLSKKERLTKEHAEPEAKARLHLCLSPAKAPRGKLAAALKGSLSSRYTYSPLENDCIQLKDDKRTNPPISFASIKECRAMCVKK